MTIAPTETEIVLPEAAPESRPRASDLLAAAAAGDPATTVSVAELVTMLGERGFGLLLIAFGLINCVPVPPGISSLAGIPMLLVALQMVLGRHAPWLPKSVLRREFKRGDIARAVTRARPLLNRIEKLCKPRQAGLFRVVNPRLIGAFVAVLSLSVMIPLPFTNFLPSLATVIIAVAMIEMDGLLLTLGVALGLGALAFSTVVTATVAGAAWLGLKALFGAGL